MRYSWPHPSPRHRAHVPECRGREFPRCCDVNTNLCLNATLQSADQVNQTNLCLDSNYAANVYTSPCDGDNTFQGWSWGGQGTAFTIQNYQTGLCLDSNSSGNLYTNPCNWNDNYQNWVPIF